MTADEPLTERQQQLMSYVDDEMTPAERAEFEQVLIRDAELAREAAQFKSLVDMSRSMALVEPTDQEIRRFWSRFYNRTEWQLGWVLLIVGLVVLAVEGIYLLLTWEAINWIVKTAALCALLGGLMLLWNATRLKLRTSHFDRYRGVMR